ncbi:hypothetical protein HK104_003111 [Borealophlyctis nickersoniae]|nr:hypothetical protein HK104_003111 [Borealophlyctis nickersoniae]
MTWKTVKSDRVLSPPEAKLWCSCIATMIDSHRDTVDLWSDEPGFKDKDDGLSFGNPIIKGPFERLSTPEQYTVLEQVTKALIQPTPTPPELTAINESAIYYVYRWLFLQFEQDEFGEEVWGEDVLDVLRSLREVEEDDATVGCQDESKWEAAIEEIADRILWDRDWEMEDMFPYGAANRAIYFKPYNGHVAANAEERLYTMVRAISG